MSYRESLNLNGNPLNFGFTFILFVEDVALIINHFNWFKNIY